MSLPKVFSSLKSCLRYAFIVEAKKLSYYLHFQLGTFCLDTPFIFIDFGKDNPREGEKFNFWFVVNICYFQVIGFEYTKWKKDFVPNYEFMVEE